MNSTISSNVEFSTGPSSNPLSMYATTNSLSHSKRSTVQPTRPISVPSTYQEAKTRAKPNAGYALNTPGTIEVPLPERPSTETTTKYGRLKNSKMLLGERDEVDPFRSSVMRDSFKPGNSLNGLMSKSFQDVHKMKTNDNNFVFKKTFNTGYATNGLPYQQKDHAPLRPEEPHKDVYREMKRKDPIEAENRGKGPSAMTTTSSTFHHHVPLQDGVIPQHPDEFYHYEAKSQALQLSGGFKTNTINTSMLMKDPEIALAPTRWSTTQKDFHHSSTHHAEKFFQDMPDKLAKPATDMINMRENMVYNRNLTGYPHRISELTQATKEIHDHQLLKSAEDMHPSVLTLMRTRDQVEYDNMHRRKIMNSTYQVSYQESKKRQDHYDRHRQAADFNSTLATMKNAPTDHWYNGIEPNDKLKTQTGFAINNIPPLVLEKPEADRSIYGSSFGKPNYDEFNKKYGHEFHPNDYKGLNTNFKASVAPYKNPQAPATLSEQLADDMKALKEQHPTVQTILKRRYPANYTDAVPTYEHKKRL